MGIKVDIVNPINGLTLFRYDFYLALGYKRNN